MDMGDVRSEFAYQIRKGNSFRRGALDVENGFGRRMIETLYQLTGFLQGKQKIGFRRRQGPRQMVIPRSTARSSAGRTAFKNLSAAISRISPSGIRRCAGDPGP